MGHKSFESIVRSLPDEWVRDDTCDRIRHNMQHANKKIVVLDDDPTGVQTVHDIDVWTSWDEVSIREAFQSVNPLFFILTNTRSFTASKAEQINREIIQVLSDISEETGIAFSIISRSDSTLRGHYPLEINVICDELYRCTRTVIDGQLIIPAFFEGQRYTTGNVHYLKEGNELVPVHQTEFAKDRTFGFTHSNLCEWVEEKTNGGIQAEQCIVISTEHLREGPEVVCAILQKANNRTAIIVNAMTYRDLDVLSLAIWDAEQTGKCFIYRTAASFVKSYVGISDQPLLTKDKMISKNISSGGLVVVGSYVQKSSVQLMNLLEQTHIHGVELNVDELLNQGDYNMEIAKKAKEINDILESGRSVVLYTSRGFITAGDREEQLHTGQRVSNALSSIVHSLTTAPRFLIAKGGITSSDVATKGLGIRKSRVLGQAAPGIPVWMTGEESLFPGMPYIVFPGNVGNETTLSDIVRELTA